VNPPGTGPLEGGGADRAPLSLTHSSSRPMRFSLSLAGALVLALALTACEDRTDRPVTTGADDIVVTDDTDRTGDRADGTARYTSVQGVLEAHPEAQAAALLEPAAVAGAYGYATFREVGDGVEVSVHVEGLEAGRRGFHVHENGSCAAGDDGTPASAAGGHFSPLGRPHGDLSDPSEERHIGDFGNITVGANGMAHTTLTSSSPRLSGERGIVGRALIVHTGEDDGTTQPTGDSGDRAVCGIITAR
jgi:superoxide dismutase, Cu-Zn family